MSPPYTNSALHLAVITNRMDEVERLLKLPDTECDHVNHRFETPLLLSLKNRCTVELISALIDHGCNVNLSNRDGITPLHLAVQQRKLLIVSKLIKHGANVNAKSNSHGYTPLHEAIAHGRLTTIQEILRLNGEAYDPTLLYFSLEKNCTDKVVLFLLDYGESVVRETCCSVKALFLSLRRKTTTITERLIVKGANINSRTKCALTLLHEAVESKNLESVCMLLFYNVSVNERDCFGRNPFEIAVMGNDYVIAKHLIDYVDDLNYYAYIGFTALHMALRHCPDIAIEIIEKGGDVNAPWHETHSIVLCLWWHATSEIFEAIWPRIDFQILSGLHDQNSFLETFVSYCKFPTDEFLKCLYMVLNSPILVGFFDGFALKNNKKSLLFMIVECDLLQEDVVKIIAILLSYGLEIFFNDMCLLYEMYGFDQCIEMILNCGCSIYRNSTDDAYLNPIVSKICYNSFHIYDDKSMGMMMRREHYLLQYGLFYTVSLENTAIMLLIKDMPEFCQRSKVPSLIQLSRDVVRDVIYKTQTTGYGFKVYQAFSELPVPLEIRDMLYLKRAIY